MSDGPPGSVVRMTVQPAVRLWVAVMLGLGAAAFFGAVMLVAGELFVSLRTPVLEALILAGLK